jgi:hypothetical protein
MADKKNMLSPALFVRVLVVPHGQQWLAQGLEYDLTAQGSSAEQAVYAFLVVLRGHLELDRKHGRTPLSGVGSAPEKFVRAFHARDASSHQRGGRRKTNP